jgi:hypothetical protein
LWLELGRSRYINGDEEREDERGFNPKIGLE